MQSINELTLSNYVSCDLGRKCSSTKKPAPSIERIKKLSHQIFPLTNSILDQYGNTIQLWSVPESRAVAYVSLRNGSTRIISSIKIQNALNPSEDPVTLHNRLLIAPSNCKWDFVLKDDGILVVWPHLIAQGWESALPGANQDLCNWEQYLLSPQEDFYHYLMHVTGLKYEVHEDYKPLKEAIKKSL